MLTSLKAEQKQKPRDTVQKKQVEKSASEPNWVDVSNGMAAQFGGLSRVAFDDRSVHYNLGRSAQLQAEDAQRREQHTLNMRGDAIRYERERTSFAFKAINENFNDDFFPETGAVAFVRIGKSPQDCCIGKRDDIVQRQPAATNYFGADEKFWKEVAIYSIQPTHVNSVAHGTQTLYVLDFNDYNCQIHAHADTATGEIIAAHIKSRHGEIRHGINLVEMQYYLFSIGEID